MSLPGLMKSKGPLSSREKERDAADTGREGGGAGCVWLRLEAQGSRGVFSARSAAGGLRKPQVRAHLPSSQGPSSLMQPGEGPGQGPVAKRCHKLPGASWTRLCRQGTEAGVRGSWETKASLSGNPG